LTLTAQLKAVLRYDGIGRWPLDYPFFPYLIGTAHWST
jgi:hypothetical protein